MSKFITILGIDYSGKTTLLNNIRCNNADIAIVSHEKEHLPTYMHFNSQMIDYLSFDTFRKDFSNELRSSIYSTIIYSKAYLIESYLRQDKTVICDSYYYKHLAKEKLYQQGTPAIHTLWSKLPQPDIVIFLDVDPQIAYERSAGNIHALEYYQSSTKEDFVLYQTHLREQLIKEVEHLPMHFIDANGDFTTVLKRMQILIDKYNK